MIIVGRLLARLAAWLWKGERAADYEGVPVMVCEKLLQEWTSGITIGNTIFVKRGFEKRIDVLSHELVHIEQWRRLGDFFIIAYFSSWFIAGLRHGWEKAYRENPFEVEAYDKEHS